MLRSITAKMAAPLFCLFWICDLLYIPSLKWQFLALRLLVFPLNFMINFALSRYEGYVSAQKIANLYMFLLAASITFMVWLTGDLSSPYYAGLNLVAVGALSFIPYSPYYFAQCVACIFAPYFTMALFTLGGLHNLAPLAINSFFIVGTVSISVVIRLFQANLKRKEIKSRWQLKEEIASRDRVIVEKTKEALNLAALSRQFSPQVVEAIKTGQIDLRPGVHRSNICAIFIDIVNSTERVTRGDKDKINRAITMFMEDVIKTLLKYDITVDKFLGDGILAFSNDPVRYDDYVDRVVRAAIEIRHKIMNRREQYIDVWMHEMQLRFGIAFGFANVGFYGNDKYYKSYTAIGPVMNLASRLCASAEPNQIVVSGDILSSLRAADYSIEALGTRSLKGFESDLIRVYEINSLLADDTIIEEIDCPKCPGGLFYLDSDPQGVLIMKCRSCGYTKRDEIQSTTALDPRRATA